MYTCTGKCVCVRTDVPEMCQASLPLSCTVERASVQRLYVGVGSRSVSNKNQRAQIRKLKVATIQFMNHWPHPYSAETQNIIPA